MFFAFSQVARQFCNMKWRQSGVVWLVPSLHAVQCNKGLSILIC